MDEKVSISIERRLLQDNKPITVKFLATQQKIHISKARLHLVSFLQQQEKNNESLPYALYSLTGEVNAKSDFNNIEIQHSDDSMDLDGVNKSFQGSHKAVYISDSDHLEETKKLFIQTPIISLYSLSPPLPTSSTNVQRVATISQLPSVQHELKNTLEYVNAWSEIGFGAKIGGIAPAKDIIRTEQNKASSSGIVPIKQDLKTDIKTFNKGNESKPLPSKSTTTKKEKEETDKAANKKIDQKSAKQMDKEEEEEEEDTPIGYVGESKVATDVPVEKGGAERKKADANDKPLSAQEEKRKRQKQELMDMMNEDKDGNADPDVPIGHSTATSMMGAAAEEEEEEEEEEEAKDNVQLDGKKRVQKERKIVRQERYTNEKGYRATRDVEETELYTTDESDGESEKTTKKAITKKAPAKSSAEAKKKTEIENNKKEQTTTSSNRNATTSAPPPKKTTNKAAGGQSKLSSFFTKKT